MQAHAHAHTHREEKNFKKQLKFTKDFREELF